MVLYFPKSNANIFITGYSLLSQILSQPAKAKLVPNRWTLSNFQIDFGRPGFIVSGAQAPGSATNQTIGAREAGDSPIPSRAVARFAGSIALFLFDPGACAPGFMLPPASRARRNLRDRFAGSALPLENLFAGSAPSPLQSTDATTRPSINRNNLAHQHRFLRVTVVMNGICRRSYE